MSSRTSWLSRLALRHFTEYITCTFGRGWRGYAIWTEELFSGEFSCSLSYRSTCDQQSLGYKEIWNQDKRTKYELEVHMYTLKANSKSEIELNLRFQPILLLTTSVSSTTMICAEYSILTVPD